MHELYENNTKLNNRYFKISIKNHNKHILKIGNITKCVINI